MDSNGDMAGIYGAVRKESGLRLKSRRRHVEPTKPVAIVLSIPLVGFASRMPLKLPRCLSHKLLARVRSAAPLANFLLWPSSPSPSFRNHIAHFFLLQNNQHVQVSKVCASSSSSLIYPLTQPTAAQTGPMTRTSTIPPLSPHQP